MTIFEDIDIKMHSGYGSYRIPDTTANIWKESLILSGLRTGIFFYYVASLLTKKNNPIRALIRTLKVEQVISQVQDTKDDI